MTNHQERRWRNRLNWPRTPVAPLCRAMHPWHGAWCWRKERIGHLVYLDAFVPEDGQSMWDVMPAGISRVELDARVQREGQGWLLPSLAPVPWDQFVRKAWHVTDEADVRWMVARLGPTPIKHFKDAVRCTNPAAAKIPRTYIRCPEYPHPGVRSPCRDVTQRRSVALSRSRGSPPSRDHASARIGEGAAGNRRLKQKKRRHSY